MSFAAPTSCTSFPASYLSFLLAPLPAVLVARLLRKPVVLNYRSGEAPDHLRRSRLARFVLHGVEVNVVPSTFLQDVFARFEIPAEIIPNIVDLGLFAFRDRVDLRPRLLCTRNFEPMYNVSCTLRAFELVQAKYPDATLTLVGAGSQAEALRQQVAAGRLRNVHFAGAVAPSEMWRYYADTDIYIQTPEIDNMPTSVLEAFSSGCPVVSTSAGGVPAILEDGVHGFLVPCGDHSAAADRVLKLLAAPQMARHVAAQARETCERYRWSAVRADWLDLYRRLAHCSVSQRDSPPPETPSHPNQPLKVAIVAPTLHILGGQAVQAQRLIDSWADDPEVQAELVPVNPQPPAPFGALRRVKFVRTLVTQLLYWPLLVRRLSRADVVHAFSASYWSFLLAPLPAMVVARVSANRSSSTIEAAKPPTTLTVRHSRGSLSVRPTPMWFRRFSCATFSRRSGFRARSSPISSIWIGSLSTARNFSAAGSLYAQFRAALQPGLHAPGLRSRAALVPRRNAHARWLRLRTRRTLSTRFRAGTSQCPVRRGGASERHLALLCRRGYLSSDARHQSLGVGARSLRERLRRHLYRRRWSSNDSYGRRGGLPGAAGRLSRGGRTCHPCHRRSANRAPAGLTGARELRAVSMARRPLAVAVSLSERDEADGRHCGDNESLISFRYRAGEPIISVASGGPGLVSRSMGQPSRSARNARKLTPDEITMRRTWPGSSESCCVHRRRRNTLRIHVWRRRWCRVAYCAGGRTEMRRA